MSKIDRELVKELAERFGYRSDAEEFRARIEQALDLAWSSAS